MSGNRFKFWLLAAALAAAAVYSFWYAFRAWAKNRTIEDTPTSRVRSAAQGYVELTGRGVPPPNTANKAPLTGLPCTWWRYKVEQRRYSGRSRSWSTVQSDTSSVPFLLDDGTGQCLIDPRGAEVFPGATDVWYGPSEWPQVHIPNGTGVFAWLVDNFVTDEYRYTEYRLQPNQELYAIGAFRSLGGVSVESPDGGDSGIAARVEKGLRGAARTLRQRPRWGVERRRVGASPRGRPPAGSRCPRGRQRARPP